MALFKPIAQDDLKDLVYLRQAIWDSTYRGIYDDDWIDHFDFAYHEKREYLKLQNPSIHTFLIIEDTHKVGYLTFSLEHSTHYKDFTLCLNSLYILPSFQGKGIGSEAMHLVEHYCKSNAIHKFYNQCNAHNLQALAFYKKLGGIIGHENVGNTHKYEDSIWLEYYL